MDHAGSRPESTATPAGTRLIVTLAVAVLALLTAGIGSAVAVGGQQSTATGGSTTTTVAPDSPPSTWAPPASVPPVTTEPAVTTPLTTPPTTEAPSYSPPSYASIPDSSICDELRAQLNAGVDSAVGDAQNNVDDIISQHPELAPYAGQAKQDLQNAAPQARAELEQALRENGC